MVAKNCGGAVPTVGPLVADDEAMLEPCRTLLADVRKIIDDQAFHEALERIWAVVRAANGYVDRQAPWALRKADKERMSTVLYVLAEVIRRLAIILQPFMPDAAARMLDQLAVSPEHRSFAFLGPSHALVAGTALPAPKAVFPRYVEETTEAGAE